VSDIHQQQLREFWEQHNDNFWLWLELQPGELLKHDELQRRLAARERDDDFLDPLVFYWQAYAQIANRNLSLREAIKLAHWSLIFQ